MSGSEWYPPPGPGTPPPGQQPPPPGFPPPPAWGSVPTPWHAAPGTPTFAPAPGMLGAAHKPGALPLRPLGLGDIYDAAFKIIRFNPKATVGSAVLVAAVSMAIPVVVTALLSWTVDLSLDRSSSSMSGADVAGLVGAFGTLGVGSILQSIGLILVTGMIAHVTMAAATGRRLSLGQAWAATRGKRWRLIGLSLLLGLLLTVVLAAYAATWIPIVVYLDGWQIALYGLLTVPLFLCFLVWFWIRVYYLPVPALMLEQVGVVGALRRGFQLTRGQFWRTFGIALLTVVIAQIAGSMLAMPVSVVGQGLLAGAASTDFAVLALVVTNALTSVISAAFVAPFTTTVTSLQYLDQRMRKEAYDVELMAQAGITAS